MILTTSAWRGTVLGLGGAVLGVGAANPVWFRAAAAGAHSAVTLG